MCLAGNAVTMRDDEGVGTRQKVGGLGAYMDRATDLRTDQGQVLDGLAAIVADNPGDDHVGYMDHLEQEAVSTWGDARSP